MDSKLQGLIAKGNSALARERLRKLLERRDKLATENYVRYCIAVAKQHGYDLTAGDVALVHPKDLPQTVQLVPRRDPVYAVAHPEVIVGKMLFVRKPLVEKYLNAALAVH